MTGVSDLKDAWAAYMHPVVLFIMCCLIFAISFEKAGLTRRMGYFITQRAGTSVTKFTFILACGLGLASSVMHDAAATAIALAVILPMMRSAGIQPNTNTARFMTLAVPFACSCGGMGTLVGGGRCIVAAIRHGATLSRAPTRQPVRRAHAYVGCAHAASRAG